MAAKAAAISRLEATVADHEASLEEQAEERQEALDSLEASLQNDKARLEEQLAALTAEKVFS